MKTLGTMISDLQTTFMTAGWREHIRPELVTMRDTLVGELIYADELSLEDMRSRALGIRLLDQILDMPRRAAEKAKELQEDPALGGDVVQSSTDSQDLADAGVKAE